jgi:Transposase domain (DUF772)
VPPARLALATIVQAYTGVSDDEVIEATVMDRRWQLVLDCLDAGEPPFSKGTLAGFRARLIEHDLDRALIERTVELAARTGGFGVDRDWDDPAARDDALAEVLGLLDRVEAFVAGQAGEQAAAAVAAIACQVRDQDVDLTGAAPVLRRGVAKDRRISVEDAQMRHGRKTRSVLFDGCKRHVLRDLDTGLIPAVGITPANAPEASVTESIAADLQAAGRTLAELHIDRACLSSHLVRDRGPDLAIYCKAWRVRNTTGRYAKDQFSIDFPAGQLTCPAGTAMPFTPGKTVRFPKGTCAACPLHHQQQRPQRRHPPRRGTAGRTARPLHRHPQEPLRPAPRRRRPQPPRHRPPTRRQRPPAGNLTT